MKKIVRALMIVLGLLLAAVLAGYIVLSPQVEVRRSVVVQAPPEKVYPHVADFEAWQAWSPWVASDPTLTTTYPGVSAGVGAVQRWRSENSGSGTQKIVSADPPYSLETVLDFGGYGTASSSWQFEPVDGGSRVTWTMESDMSSPPIARFFTSAVEAEVGEMYEKGLAALKAVTENEQASAPPPPAE